MYERTMITVENRVARVVTRPRRDGRGYEYRFHRKGDAWVLSRERDWYTAHALEYAEKELDAEVMRRQVGREQTTFDDYEDDGDCPSGFERDAPAARAAD